MNPFPPNFLWGAATSAHQVEGHNHNDWTEWEKLGLVKNHDRSGQACGHYERFHEDFALAKKLGHNAHRFSLEWSRIEPRPGVYDLEAIEHYRQVLEELHHSGIEPIVTLHHFTLPIWVARYGAWSNQRMVDDFGRYVMTIVKTLGPLIKYWVTINEPTVITSLGYLTGIWPPQKHSWVQAWVAIRRMVTAHKLAYQIIHRHYPDARIGVANNLSDFVPAQQRNLLDRGLAGQARYWHNRWWLDQTYQTQDFIGLNYYFHHPVHFQPTLSITKLMRPVPDPRVLTSDLGWEIHPAGMLRLIEWLQQYQRPIIITENGIADAADHLRAAYIRDHVKVLAIARQRGYDIRGYLHWSLLDNFEWREGFSPRFGLIEVDYHTLKRTIRPSAYTYKQICEQNGL